MKIINLIEDISMNPEYEAEHGLSFYIEARDKKILFDTGATGLFILNARKAGVSLGDVDLCVISHGHYDHGGGLMTFLEMNEDALIYINENAFGKYFHVSPGEERYIGLNRGIPRERQVHRCDNFKQISPGMWVFAGVSGRRFWPSGNAVLKEKTMDGYNQDEFVHEQNFVIEEDGKYYLFAGCSHNGPVNILDQFKEFFPGKSLEAYIGGFHLMQKRDYTLDEIDNIKALGEELLTYDCKRFYTCHCTSLPGYDILKEIMGDKIQYVHSGDVVC